MKKAVRLPLEQVKAPWCSVWQPESAWAYKKGMGNGERVTGYTVLHGLFHQFAFGHTADVQSEQKLLEYIMKMAQLNAMLI